MQLKAEIKDNEKGECPNQQIKEKAHEQRSIELRQEFNPQLPNEQEQLQNAEIDLLLQQCQELAHKLKPRAKKPSSPTSCSQVSFIISQFSINTKVQLEKRKEQKQIENYSIAKEKNRLEAEYIDLVLEVERQNKEREVWRAKLTEIKKQVGESTQSISEKQDLLVQLQEYRNKNVKEMGASSIRK